jgi:hypothetical protein
MWLIVHTQQHNPHIILTLLLQHGSISKIGQKFRSESITTLALGSWLKQGLARLRAKKEARESHLVLPRVQKSVKEWTLTFPSELPLWNWNPKWTPKFSKNNYRGQNSLDWCVPSIIKKLLALRCFKWPRMTHLRIWNTNYGQKKGWESNWQFDSHPLKVKNRPNFLVCRWRATYHWKTFNEGYNFALELISIGGLHPKSWESQLWEFWDSQIPRQNAIWM